MNARLARFAVPAMLALAIPVAAAFAQAQDQQPRRPAGPSPETLARLQDGRIAMIKETLRLNEAQLKLWAPVEAQMRASFAARQKAREERRQARQQGAGAPSLPDRLDGASERMAQLALRMKAFAEALRPLYASLSDDQKAVAGVVLRQSFGGGRGFHGYGRRWAEHHAPAPEQK
jgi:LTXXQ motif family protein